MEKTTGAQLTILKKAVLHVLFIIETFFIFKTLSTFVESKNYLSVARELAIPLLIVTLFSLWTLAVISQTMQKKQEIFVLPVIMFFSSFIFLAKFKTLDTVVGALLSFLYFAYQIRRTYFVKESLLKIDITQSARHITKGFLFTTAFVTALSVFLISKDFPTIDVGQKVANIAEKPIKRAVEKEYEDKLPTNTGSFNFSSNSQISNVLESLGIKDIPTGIPTSEKVSDSVVGGIKNSISSQVNKAVEPYKDFLNPTLALLVFGMLQLYNFIAYAIYSATISLIFLFLKKTRVVEIEKTMVEKEVVKL